MTDRRRFLSQLGAGSLALGGSVFGGFRPLLAHRSHVTLTRLLLNAQSGRWELIHAIHYHDAATALRRLEPGAGLVPTTPDGQARLMFEIEQHIHWSGANGVIQPVAVGAELAGDSVLLYQECLPALPGTPVQLESRFLHREFSDQVNHFNIEIKDPPRLLRLSAATPLAAFTA